MGTLTILHVDDDLDLLDAVALCLRQDSDVKVVSAGSGLEALGLLERGLAPDVIVLDVSMPGLDGPETLARLRAMPGLERTPAAFMTAGRPPQPTPVGSFGAAAVIAKPFDPVTLAHDLRSLVPG